MRTLKAILRDEGWTSTRGKGRPFLGGLIGTQSGLPRNPCFQLRTIMLSSAGKKYSADIFPMRRTESTATSAAREDSKKMREGMGRGSSRRESRGKIPVYFCGRAGVSALRLSNRVHAKIFSYLESGPLGAVKTERQHEQGVENIISSRGQSPENVQRASSGVLRSFGARYPSRAQRTKVQYTQL